MALGSYAKELTAQEIIDKVDSMNTAADRSSDMRMALIDRDGKESVREVKIWTKGDEKRLIKFLSPADVRGTGFLVLNADTPDEKMYLYLPAFKRIRRIAGSAKSGSFMGSDFSYSDIGSGKYSQDYEVKRLPDRDGNYLLEMKKKKGADTEYDKLISEIDRERFVPVRVEFYSLRRINNRENYDLMKVMTAEDIQKIGKYHIPGRITMEDVKRSHRTVLELSDIKLDTGIPDTMFTERSLQR